MAKVKASIQVSWENGFDQRIFLNQLAKISSGGGFSELDGEGAGLIALLRSMIVFSETLPWEIRHDLISKSIRHAISRSATTPEEFLRVVRSVANDYAALPKSTFLMFTSISVLRSNRLSNIQMRGVEITFAKNMPSRVLKQRSDIFRDHRNWLPLNSEPSFKAIKMSVEARNFEEAASRCLDAIDLLRGIWNFLETPPWRRTVIGPRKPVNKIFLGPLHTFHHENGNLRTSQYWYESKYFRGVDVSDLRKDGGVTLRNTRKIQKILANHKYTFAVESAFIRYARALDLEDHDLAIQRLWSLLEFLTDTGLGNYDKTIRRAKFLYKDILFNGQILEHLRMYRNRSVHGNSSSDNDVEIEIYQIKRVVDAVLGFHLSNRFNFNSMEKACNFLDLPSDLLRLKDKSKDIRRAIAFRTPF